MTINEELTLVYIYLGRPPQDKLKKSAVYEFYAGVVAQCFVDLGLSNSNQQLIQTSEAFNLSERESAPQVIPAYARVLSLEYQPVLGFSAEGWSDVRVLDAVDVSTAAASGERGVAVYSAPLRFRTTFDPSAYLFRAHYTRGEIELPTNLADSPGLSQAFSHMRVIKTALVALPHAGHDAEKYSQLQASLMHLEAEWTPRWLAYVRQKAHRSATRRTATNADRRALRRGYR